MAFLNRISNMLKQTVSKHVNLEVSSNSVLHLTTRSMSSSSSKVFVGGENDFHFPRFIFCVFCLLCYDRHVSWTGLSYGTDEPSLRDAFSQYGEVVEGIPFGCFKTALSPLLSVKPQW